MGLDEHSPQKKISGKLSFTKQVLIVLLVLALLVLFVAFVDTYLLDIGIDWSQSTLVRMIIERRALPLIE